MNTLGTRALTAIIAVSFIATVTYFGGSPALKILCSLFVIVAVYESRTIFFRRWPRMCFALLVFPLTWCVEVYRPELSTSMLLLFDIAIIGVFILGAGVLLSRHETHLEEIFAMQAHAILGLYYGGVLTWFIIHLLDLQKGLYWFTALLVIVFGGDIMAYFFGNFWGKEKILPSVSPNKTVIGAWGGIIGSTLGAGACSLILPEMPLVYWLVLGPAVGAIAQVGDFAESLFKRVAAVKDSGGLLPGHGGVLDRVDGVLFTAPIFYIIAQFFV